MSDIDEGARERVLAALADDKYRWRTVRGIAAETKLSPELVRAVIDACGDEVVRSSVRSKTGEDLFTTREHFRRKGSALGRILGAFKNRAR